ncbi:hypothetical protein [Pseudonocardia sp. TRM90224]|uniref:hypothetical protein n=1 Tax=Pseudonocardia sp. TRM90224 TaxID=2812678 RepID=UPI001E2D4B2B|nr:hypothetical protein [Pseudonocardia sp. TRM90224]
MIMLSRSDDELYSVQGRYLGPPGRTLLWQARYIAYVIWAGYAFVFVVVRQQLSLLPGLAGYAVVALAAVIATVATMRHVSVERPPSAVLAMFLAELRTPRHTPPPSPTVAVSDPRNVAVHLSVPHLPAPQVSGSRLSESRLSGPDLSGFWER